MTDFPALLRALAGIDYILVGGVAASVHGSIRNTRDLDIVYSRSAENLSRVVRALAPLAPYPRGAPEGLPFVWDERTVNAGLCFTLTTKNGELDLLGEVTGGGRYEDLVPISEVFPVFGLDVRVVTLPTLIRLKRATGRPKDFEAIAELEALLEEKQKQS